MTENKHRRFSTVKKIPELYPDAFTISSIRWLIINAEKNGFSCCVKRLGRRVLIDCQAMEAWIVKQGGKKK